MLRRNSSCKVLKRSLNFYSHAVVTNIIFAIKGNIHRGDQVEYQWENIEKQSHNVYVLQISIHILFTTRTNWKIIRTRLKSLQFDPKTTDWVTNIIDLCMLKIVIEFIKILTPMYVGTFHLNFFSADYSLKMEELSETNYQHSQCTRSSHATVVVGAANTSALKMQSHSQVPPYSQLIICSIYKKWKVSFPPSNMILKCLSWKIYWKLSFKKKYLY